MKSLSIPAIPYNCMSNLKPELIGLAAYLAATDLWPTDRRSIIEHVAEGGELDESARHKGFHNNTQVANAAKAHAAWLEFVDDLRHTQTATAVPLFQRNGNGNGHRLELPPIAGGAPVRQLDPAGVNGMSDPDDIEF